MGAITRWWAAANSRRALRTWLVKHVVSPMDRVSFRLAGGRLRLTIGRPVFLLSTVGRRTGEVRSTPVFYVLDRSDFVVCNVRPPGERPNPWPPNLDHQRAVHVTIKGHRLKVTARRATAEEVDRLRSRLIRIWPSYADYYRHTNERDVFVLSPRSDSEDSGSR